MRHAEWKFNRLADTIIPGNRYLQKMSRFVLCSGQQEETILRRFMHLPLETSINVM